MRYLPTMAVAAGVWLVLGAGDHPAIHDPGGGPSGELSPGALAIGERGGPLYVACATGGRVLVVDPPTGRISASHAVPAPPLGLALSKSGEKLYVACARPESVVVELRAMAPAPTSVLPAPQGSTTTPEPPSQKPSTACCW